MKTLQAIAIASLALFSSTVASPQQFCLQKAATATDICLALASAPNATTGANDLALHLSVSVPDTSTGWAAFGIGDRMHGALMFVLYPGSTGDEVTVSVRSTKGHTPPKALDASSSPAAPDIHVTRTWISHHGFLNAQIMCYNCSSWEGTSWTKKKFDILGTKQSWIWATNNRQASGSDEVEMVVARHTDFGHATIDMSKAYSSSGSLVIPEVASSRVMGISDLGGSDSSDSPLPSDSSDPSTEHSETDTTTPEAHPVHHKHSPLGVVSIHGFILTTGFLLVSTGVMAIRSGLANSFKLHWVIQTTAGGLIAMGYLLGIYISFKHGGKFKTLHQLIGLLIVPTVAAQGLLGYYHHINFVKYGRRTKISYWHIWVGRLVLVVGNTNVLFGLVLSRASTTKFYFAIINLSIQITLLSSLWYFWSKGQTIREVVTKKDAAPDYESVNMENEAFILEGDSDEDEDEERAGGKGGRGRRSGDVELKPLTEKEKHDDDDEEEE